MSEQVSPTTLVALSSELAGVVERIGPAVVRVDDGSRLTATGLLWSADGVILTTSHGVERDEGLAVETSHGARHPATLVGRDPEIDLAVLRVSAASLPVAERAPMADVRVGHLVLAVGRPGNAGLQATLGIISAILETERNGQVGYVVHTDAVLYPGFSGGALVDVQGRVVGMTNLMFGRGKGVAIGTPLLQQMADTLLAHGRVPRAYLGIRTQAAAVPEALRQKLALTQEHALLIVQVETGSAAEQGGLMLGDLLLALNDQPAMDADQLRQRLRLLTPGQAAKLRLARGGEALELTVTLGGGE
jgi:S1-C subfamily serine protease